jgi:hypothetical protein
VGKLKPPDPRVCAALDAVLSADAFDDSAVRLLARRDTYADAARCLSELTGARSTLIPALLEAESLIAPYRFAVRFGVLSARTNLESLYAVDDLRAHPSPEATLALIALGEIDDWSAMGRRGRAVFSLRRLVRAMVRDRR